MLVKPVIRSMKYHVIAPKDVYMSLKDQTSSKYSYLLESCEGDAKSAQYSFLGVHPIGRISIHKNKVDIEGETFSKIDKSQTEPLSIIKSSLGDIEIQNSSKKPRFIGGVVGYFSYDLIRYYLPYLEEKNTDISMPDAEFIYTKDTIAFDHRSSELEIVCSAVGEDERDLKDDIGAAYNRVADIEEIVLSSEKNELRLSESKKLDYVSDTSEEEYMNMVRRTKEYIREGDIFQTVISKRNSLDSKNSHETYLALKTLNPSPYLYFLEFGDNTILGSSPEMLIRVEDRHVTTRPIAGTRKRGATEKMDRYLANEMISDPKECAEHIMLVDLHRNDLGRVCEYETVKTTELMGVERFSHVQHIVSTVEGDLHSKYTSFDALKSIFPAGTVSGAPKVRAMEIINELEHQRRGAYAGAVGYFGLDQNIDFAITIRTIIQNKKNAYVQAGAGIVSDSDPKKEWVESENKAAAMMKALSMVS